MLKRLTGQTLKDAWQQLSSAQKMHIAYDIAQYCYKLASSTSTTFESATKRGVLAPFVTTNAKPSHPSWKPRLLGPLDLMEFCTHFSNLSTQACPGIGTCSRPYHVDLGPTNIMVSDDGLVNESLDWESAGFYPAFWIALKPLISAAFYLDSSLKGVE